MSTGMKISVSLYVYNISQEGIVSLGCFHSKTDATVSLILLVRSSSNSSGCKTPPFSLSQKNRTALRIFNFRTRFENVQWRSSIFWAPQDFPSYPGGVIRVFHNIVKGFTTPQVKSKQNALSYLRVIVNALGALEDNGLENDHPLSVPLPSTDPIKFYRKDFHKSLPKFPGRCVIALGQNTNKFSPLRLTPERNSCPAGAYRTGVSWEV